MWLREVLEHYLHKSTNSHHMQTLCQRILWSCLIHFIGTFSTAYFSLFLSITEQSPYFLPDSSLIAIGIAPWFLANIYHYIDTDQFVHLHEEGCSHVQRQNFFMKWNATWYSWVGKTLDIIASSIISTYDIDQTQNSILKIHWFHTPASHFSRNGHDTMGDIAKWKLSTKILFHIFCGRFFAHPSPDILTKHNIKENDIKGNIYGPFYIHKGEGSGGG